jgi:hypothetical protein
MLIDINHFIEKDKKPPRHFIPRELFNYEPPSPVKLKDIETADEYLAAYRFYKRNFNITDDVLLKAMVTYNAKYKPTKKDIEAQLRKMKKKNKPILKSLRDYAFVNK